MFMCFFALESNVSHDSPLPRQQLNGQTSTEHASPLLAIHLRKGGGRMQKGVVLSEMARFRPQSRFQVRKRV